MNATIHPPLWLRAVMRTGAAILAIALTSCGSGGGNGGSDDNAQPRLVTVSGEVTGLVGASRATLLLSDGTIGMTDGTRQFSLSALMAPGSSYSVSFLYGNPPGYLCASIDGTFSANLAPVSLSLSCNLREWTWVAGTDASLHGSYNGPGLSGAPGARDFASTWVGADNSLWLFGGTGFTDGYSAGHHSDLWRYSPSTGQWTWVSGSVVASQAGSYVAIGSVGTPGSRSSAMTWTDASGRLWLFGGSGLDGSGNWGPLDDLWRYDPATDQWTWMAGSSAIAAQGTYHARGAAGSPGARGGGVAWKDASGHLWLFGGYGYGETSTSAGYLNDLWRFDTTNLSWIWEGGSKSISSPGVYEGRADTLYPGARDSAVVWQTSSSEVWLFGGYGVDESLGSLGKLGDFWRFDLETRQWTWKPGTKSIESPGYYPQLGDFGYPSARWGAVAWTDSHGGMWLFGGRGLSSAAADGDRNDVWHFNRRMETWTWVRGDESLDTSANATAIGAAGDPGGRRASAAWADSQGRLWLYGGARGWFPSQLASLWRY